MNYKLLVIILLQFALAETQGQSFERENYVWEENKEHSVADKFLDNSAIFLMYHVMMEFNPYLENTDKQQYYVKHSKVLLQKGEALDRYNKFYISQKDSDVSSTKLRIIKSDGTIKQVNTDDVKEGIEEESGISYLYYAIDGLEVGDIIESIIKVKMVPQFYGRQEYIQQDHPVLDYYFELIYPNFLEYGFKTFNADIEPIEKNLDEKRVIYSIQTENLPSKTSEPFAFVNTNRQFHIFKLDKNNSSGSYDINGYGHMSQAIGERGLNYEYTKDEKKKLDKLFKKIDIKDSSDIKGTVHIVEHFLKSNFTFIDTWEREAEAIENILYTNSYNAFGALKLYDYFLEKVGITCQAIMTCDRTDFKFDEDFESYIFLDKLFVYIPDIETSLDPSNEMSRLQFYETGYQNHKGLFIRTKKIGGQTSAIGKIKDIPGSSADENLTRLDIEANLTSDFDDMKISVTKELHGLNASYFQPLFSVVEKEMMEEFKSYVIYAYPNQYISKTVEFKNTEAEAFPMKPLICSFDLKNEDFWEKGGNSFLFKLGALIGPQSQLYNEEIAERTLDIQSDNARRYTYEIVFNIPEGLEAANLDDIKMNLEDNSSEYTYYFKSDYKVEGDKVIVNVDEIYDRPEYPASEFIEFQKVINAAADFNKIKIVFKPKK